MNDIAKVKGRLAEWKSGNSVPVRARCGWARDRSTYAGVCISPGLWDLGHFLVMPNCNCSFHFPFLCISFSCGEADCSPLVSDVRLPPPPRRCEFFVNCCSSGIRTTNRQ
ncbi:hypothetical protein HDV57DRAFT_483675 [Trichoderma longibrachiatum]|uniref:Uncharacterized protein n=1 Tax=Trichoderma longibrachiatum ATCC 18648 TaxID=983965 RepID=A0A2T4C7V9_TRILO|nr:hypothetical protein M440DRAFT_1217693 [Trichoderma longibrachiatum ATCC 18648]